ncbi:MAG: methionine--tRNA ligase [Gemmatimonadota bacterium]|jgi:methionyl-tRNA synthetase|nr:MAG: methionine--tRNA ligase [Gemmatimonadota bacterium]
MGRYYLTTAIDYANGEPHAGHAFEKVGADVIARYRRALGDDVYFSIGMDEHGQGIAEEAERRDADPQGFVDELADLWAGVWARLEISNDDFIRTTEGRHRRAVEAIVSGMRASGDLYVDRYAGFYCVRCERFRKEEELVDGRCPYHPSRDITWTEEENWFFRLSRYRDPLIEHIGTHPEFIQPASRRNEILRLLEGGLEDISASRSRLPWGIPFPGTEDHTVYVWIDALTNYLSATGFPDEEYTHWWPARLHIIGKDITRFHCVIWPAMLMSAGLELPETVWAHGFVSVAGGKISKDAGSALGLDELIDRHGTDAFRYFLVREVPWDGDREFASAADLLDRFDLRYNAELANDIGNLVSRSAAMVHKYRGGEATLSGSTALDEARTSLARSYHEAMQAHLLHSGLEAVLGLVRRANAFIDEQQPWQLAKEDGSAEALDDVLGALVACLRGVAAMLGPFMPRKAEEIWCRMGGAAGLPSYSEAAVPAAPSPAAGPEARARVAVLRGPPLFPRYEPGP